MDLLIYGIGYFIVFVGLYLWNVVINRSDMPSWDKEKQTVPVGVALIVSVFSWIAIGLMLMFVIVALIIYALIETNVAKGLDVFFSGKKRGNDDNDI